MLGETRDHPNKRTATSNKNNQLKRPQGSLLKNYSQLFSLF